MPDVPKGPIEKAVASNAAKDLLEAGRRVVKKVEGGAEALRKKAEQVLNTEVAEDAARLLDRVRQSPELQKLGRPMPREQVKLPDPINLTEVRVPSRPFPTTPHGNEVRALLEKYAEVRDTRFLDELGRFTNKEEIPAFLEILRSDERSVMKAAAAAKLQQLGAQEAVPDLVKALKNAGPLDNDISFRVTDALVTLDTKRTSVPALIESLQRSLKLGPEDLMELEADLVRTDLVKALGAMKDKRAVPALTQLLMSGETGMETSRKYAMEALAKINTPESFAALKRALAEGVDGASFFVASFHVKGEDEAALALMQAAKTAGTLDVRVQAVEQLAAMAIKEPQGKIAKFLKDLVNHPDTHPEIKMTIGAVLNAWPKVIPFHDR